jgi:hypothetical protein
LKMLQPKNAQSTLMTFNLFLSHVMYHTTQTTPLPTTVPNTTLALLSTLALNEEESSDTISVTTTAASFPTPMTHTTQAPLSTSSAPKEDESSATTIGLIVTIALLVLTSASIALVAFCRQRRRKTRESIATRQAQELELRPLQSGVGDDIIVHHGPDPHGSLESVCDQIPNSSSPDDGTNDHYDLPEASDGGTWWSSGSRRV